jgi:hypothetical protein
MYFFAYVAATAIAALGVALAVFPVRSTRALHEWYLVPPEVRAHQKLGLVACRLVGIGLLIGAAVFAISITDALGRVL